MLKGFLFPGLYFGNCVLNKFGHIIGCFIELLNLLDTKVELAS